MIGGASGLLLSAAAGYWVLERAEGHKRGLRRAGRWLGGAIILIALAGVACRIISCTSACPWAGSSNAYMKMPMTPRTPSLP